MFEREVVIFGLRVIELRGGALNHSRAEAQLRGECGAGLALHSGSVRTHKARSSVSTRTGFA